MNHTYFLRAQCFNLKYHPCTEDICWLCLVQAYWYKFFFVENSLRCIMRQLVKLRACMHLSEFARSNFKSCHFHTENSMLVEKGGQVCWFVDRHFWNEVVFEEDLQRWGCWQGLVVLLVMKMLFGGIMLQEPRKEMWKSTRRQTKLKVMLRIREKWKVNIFPALHFLPITGK